MNRTINLPYGDSHITINLPGENQVHVLTGKQMPGLKDEPLAMREALRNPLGCASLTECVHKNDKVVIITTDNTRHCPDNRILPVIVEELEQKVDRKNITIVVALGLHAPLNQEELAHKLGSHIVQNYRVLNHNPDNTVFLGTTSAGTPVDVFSPVAEADFRISTGFIEPHFFAGFSGGRKSVAPGVSGGSGSPAITTGLK